MKKQLLVTFVLGMVVLAVQAQVQLDSLSEKNLRVGYSSVSSQTLTGAVDKVTGDLSRRSLSNSSLEALNGQAAGVQVQSGNDQETMVNAVRVRGNTSLTASNDPLVIIDGVTADLMTLSTIYPSDIESFTILKDASETSQYGSRGAAGVIEVATKKGRGQKFHISYDGSIGFEHIFKRTDMLNAAQFRQAAEHLGMTYIDKGADTDFTTCMERTGFVINQHLSFGGGTETANYRASLGVVDHKSVIRTNRFRNYIAKLNISQYAFDKRLSVDLGVFGSLQKNEKMPFLQKLYYSADTFNPTFPDGPNQEGGYDEVVEASWINNPNSLMEMSNDEDNGHFNVHMNVSFLLAKGLKLRLFGSYSYNSINNSHYYPSFVWNLGEAYRGNEKNEEGLGNVSLDYILKSGSSDLNLMVLVEEENQKSTGFYTTTTKFSTDAFGYNKLKAGAVCPWDGTDSYFTESHMQSLLFHAQYTLLERYTLTANARGDASSKFGENNRWGFFPSVSGAWIITKEQWMKNQKIINSAKLRVGYGLSGNLGGIDSYYSMQMFQPNGIVSVGGSPATTLEVIRNANPDLRWEVKRTFNLGLDLSFWHKRIALKVDYYRSKTTDMLYLYDVPVPPYTYNKLLANLGSMKNSGLEIGFGITPLRTSDIELTVNMNWSFERNKLISLNGEYNGHYLTAPSMKGISSLWGAGFHGASTVVYQVVGQPLGVFYLPHCKGLVEKPDGSKYYDVTSEKYICGQATPKALMGSNVALRYKHWDLTMQVNGAFGHKIYNGTSLTYMNMLSMPNYNVMEGAPEQNIQDQTISDYWLEKGDYVNIDYLTVGWTMPVRFKYIKSLRISASINNLATITGYSGLSPIINSSVINESLGIDDKRTTPVYRSFTIGVSVKF